MDRVSVSDPVFKEKNVYELLIIFINSGAGELCDQQVQQRQGHSDDFTHHHGNGDRPWG